MHPTRFMYAEGMKLVKRYEEEEAELADKLKVSVTSSGGGWVGVRGRGFERSEREREGGGSW